MLIGLAHQVPDPIYRFLLSFDHIFIVKQIVERIPRDGHLRKDDDVGLITYFPDRLLDLLGIVLDITELGVDLCNSDFHGESSE